jgi:predicted nucleic acid-binding protein
MIIIDTNIFLAYLNKRDQYHDQVKPLVRKLLKGEYGNRYSISEVFSETVTLLYRKTLRKSLIERAWEIFYSKEKSWATIYMINMDIIKKAKEILIKYGSESKKLSFVDSLLIATALNQNIKQILSFDYQFDGILKRIN